MIDLKNMPVDMFLGDSMKAELQKAVEIYTKVQNAIFAITDDESGESVSKLRVGTVMAFAVVNKLAEGKSPKNFTEEDWKEIAEEVLDKGVILDGRDYSKLVFLTYADYIDASAAKFKILLSDQIAADIRMLAEELRIRSRELEEDQITEVNYTEACLWISLEAMIKLLSATLGAAGGRELSQLTQAMVAFAFEYGRLALWRKEDVVLTEYLENQHMLDEELAENYRMYLDEIQAYSERFDRLVESAFDPDLRNRLMHSAALAEAAGVKDSEILKNIDDVDTFFLE